MAGGHFSQPLVWREKRAPIRQIDCHRFAADTKKNLLAKPIHRGAANRLLDFNHARPGLHPLGRLDLNRQAVAVIRRLVLGGGAGGERQRGECQLCCLKDARHPVSPFNYPDRAAIA